MPFYFRSFSLILVPAFQFWERLLGVSIPTLTVPANRVVHSMKVLRTMSSSVKISGDLQSNPLVPSPLLSSTTAGLGLPISSSIEMTETPHQQYERSEIQQFVTLVAFELARMRRDKYQLSKQHQQPDGQPLLLLSLASWENS